MHNAHNSSNIATPDPCCTNTALQKLDLSNNQITGVGAGELAEALLKNTTLANLDLRFNKITEGKARRKTKLREAWGNRNAIGLELGARPKKNK